MSCVLKPDSRRCVGAIGDRGRVSKPGPGRHVGAIKRPIAMLGKNRRPSAEGEEEVKVTAAVAMAPALEAELATVLTTMRMSLCRGHDRDAGISATLCLITVCLVTDKLRRQAQAAATRQNIKFQISTAEQVQVLPPMIP
jgi:hypothetical protein